MREDLFLALSRINEDLTFDRGCYNKAVVTKEIGSNQAVFRVAVLPKRLLRKPDVPDIQEAICATCDDLMALTGPVGLVALQKSENMRTYEMFMVSQDGNRLSGLAVPDPSSGIGRSRDKLGSIGAVSQRPNSFLVALHGALAFDG